MDIKTLSAFALIAALGGCASTGANYEPIVDGPVGYGYSSDLHECRQIAQQRGYINGDTKVSAATGAVLGGIIGAADAKKGKTGESAAAGAVAGALLGAGGTAIKAHGERKNIVKKCMTNRGHNVVG